MDDAGRKLYDDAKNADDAWTAELQKVFGRKAGDARYDKRGTSTPRLKELREDWGKKNDEWMNYMRRNRG